MNSNGSETFTDLWWHLKDGWDSMSLPVLIVIGIVIIVGYFWMKK